MTSYNLRPSASSIWTKCAANPRISENAKTLAQDSDAAREGTCAAWVAERVFATGAPVESFLGATHENEWVVDDEMIYFVGEYVKVIRSRGARVDAEQFVRLTDHIAGTYDASVLSDDGTTLYLDDLKYGYKIVDVYENTQTIIYAYADILRRNDPAITHVVIGIYQPRAWHTEGIHRTWKLSIAELHAKASEIAAAGDACQAPDALATPGEHCEYCKGRLECAALAHTVYNHSDIIERRDQGVMSADELAKEKIFLERARDLLNARDTAVSAEMTQRITSGEYVPGWSLKDRMGHRKWKTDMVTVQMLTGINPVKQAEMTPAELERAGADKKVVKGLTYTPKVGVKLDRVTDRDFGRMFRDRG